MPSLKTNSFRVHAAEQMYDSLFEANGTIYYAFAGVPDPWSNESDPPVPTNSIRSGTFDVYDSMLFGKIVGTTDAAFVVPRYDWVANTVYSMYDDRNDDLAKEPFFVVIEESTQYHVFKCLDNNGGSPSTVPPSRSDTSEDDDYYATSDGYQWKYLYSVSGSTFNKFATPYWIPVAVNANVTANAVVGAIDVITVVDPGNQYNSYANGYFVDIAVGGDETIFEIEATSSANTDFYKGCAMKIVEGQGAGQQRLIAEYSVQGGFKRVILAQEFGTLPNESSKYEITPNVTVSGDGTGCVARALIDSSSNTISKIEITTRGTDYTYAEAIVTGNTGIISVNNSVLQANNAVLRPIIPPYGGHGSDINKELGAVALGFSITFANTEQQTISTDGEFRQVGLIKDPKFANVELTVLATTGDFVDGERVTVDGVTGPTGIVSYYDEPTSLLRLTSAVPGFTANTIVRGASSNAAGTISSYKISGSTKTFATFDQRVRLDTTFNGTPSFTAGEIVTQEITQANGHVHTSNSSYTALTNVRGILNITEPQSGYFLAGEFGVANVNAIVAGDILKGSGEVLYIENIQPVTRSPLLSETIKFIIRF